MILSVVKQLFSAQSQAHSKGIRVSHMWASTLILIALITTLTPAIRLQPIAAAVPAASRSTSVIKSTSVTTTIAPVATQNASAPTPTAPNAKVVTPQDCTPTGASSQPTAVNLSTALLGYSQAVDAPMYYQIFGNTSLQIQTQLQACAPHNAGSETFAGETSYALVWQYAPRVTSNGLCTVNAVKVGLHTTMSLPSWSATAQATSGLASKWQNFIRNLTLHENGHAALDAQYAAQLLSELQNYPATDCATLSAVVQSKTSAILASLDAANVNYDAQTNHGATQGAILP